MKTLVSFIWFLAIPALAISQNSLTYKDLFTRLYDMENLARPPLQGEQSGNFSSYERGVVNNVETEWGSRYDARTDSYINWEAYQDGIGYIRNEGEDIVIFEKDGPGVIWRFWSAQPLNGHIRIYIDNSPDPVIDIPFMDFFKFYDGSNVPAVINMNLPNLSMILSRGSNRFIPIPYNKHCKIVMEKSFGAYYHITYSTFPRTTQLPVFDGTYAKDICFDLANTDRILGNRGYKRNPYDNEEIISSKVKLGKRSTKTIQTLSGNRAITQFRIRFDENKLSEKEIEDMLKNAWLRITWDDDTSPSVMAPLGMFFGSYPRFQPYRTIPLGAFPGQLYSNWFMPFSKSAKIELINKSEASQSFSVEIVHASLQQSADELLRFHAKWQDGLFKDEVQSKGRDRDWPVLVCKGKGRFCGFTLHVLNEWKEPEEEAESWWYGVFGQKTINWWWGEGDEKFYVDGEKMPSTFGTGSEDYFGYAWSAEPPFALWDSPFAAQPQTPVNGNGHTIASRFHIADNIPFQTSFTAVLEKYKSDTWGKDKNTCLFQTVAYFYLLPGQVDPY